MVHAFQSRIEAIRRTKAEKKEAKQLKAKGLLIPADCLLDKVFRAESGSDAEVWLLAADQARGHLCHLHFYYETCTNRRCKWSHATSIAHLKNAVEVEDDSGSIRLTEPPLDYFPSIRSKLWPSYRFSSPTQADSFAELHDLPLFDYLSDSDICSAAAACKALRISACDSEFVNAQKRKCLPALLAARHRVLLKGKNTSRLRFIGANGVLAHHGSSIQVFLNWERENEAAKAQAAAVRIEAPHSEAAEGSHTEEGVAILRNGTSWSGLPDEAIRTVLAMSIGPEVCSTIALCVGFRRVSRLDAAVRTRKREGLARLKAKKGKKGGNGKKKRQEKGSAKNARHIRRL
jgi:hypothetical protein